MPIINGTNGDDVLTGTPDDDQIYGLHGRDIIFGLDGNDLIDGGDGSDQLRGGEGDDQIYGGAGDEFLRGDNGDDLIDGGSGLDRVAHSSATSGVTVNLNLQGVAQDTGQGMDTLIGIEHVSGTVYDDVITGDGNDNWLWGGSFGTGFTGNDTIAGGDGNDLVEVGNGNHSLDGGAGNDTLWLYGNTTDITDAGVTVSLALQGGAQDTEQGIMTISGFENLSGSIHDDNLSGDAGANALAGDVGNDSLSGGAGDDVLLGDGRIGIQTNNGGSGSIITTNDLYEGSGETGGDDVLEGGDGNDVLNGGSGSDTASYASAAGGVFVNLFIQGGAQDTGQGNDTLIGIDNVTGSEHHDTLIGNNDGNVLTGLGGSDYLSAFGGDDAIYGGDGGDYLIGGAGNDLLDGGSGIDRAGFSVGATAGVTVDLNIQGVAQDTGQGMDTLVGIENVSGTRFSDTITGNEGDNWLWGGSDGSGVTGNDTIAAGDGDDLVEVGTGNHDLDGGDGVDTLMLYGNTTDITDSGVTVSLLLQGAAQDTEQGVMTISGFENLSGSIHDDNLTGDGGANVLAGAEGSDSLSGGAGDDVLLGDGLIGPNTLNGNSGATETIDDLYEGSGFTGGDDVLEGGHGNDVLNGGSGSDTASYASAAGGVFVNLFIQGGGGQHTGQGFDTLIGIENVAGSAFADIVIGNDEDNRLDGGAGHDVLRGWGGNDVLIGGDGDDFLVGNAGDDLMDGGAGWDRASFSTAATTGITVDLMMQGVAQNTGHGMDTLIGIEHVSGTRFDDHIQGDGNDNWLWGGSDGSGVTGNDVIGAGDGNDLVMVGTGNHSLDGGAGTDTVSLYGNGTDITAAGVTFDLNLQGSAQDTEQGMMNVTGFENATGSAYDDLLIGDGGGNLLAGVEGADMLQGGDGDDVLLGDGFVHADTHGIGTSGPVVVTEDVFAGSGFTGGNDVLDGGDGNDRLVGGSGDDVLTGGKGDDVFAFGPGTGDDRITDFGKKDVIEMIDIPGVDDFSDLIITSDSSGNTVISWGTGDSITLEGFKAKKLSADNFDFGAPAPSMTMARVFEDEGAAESMAGMPFADISGPSHAAGLDLLFA